MKQLVFATHNKNKLAEVQSILQGKYQVLGLTELGLTEEIAEHGNSFAENASLKTHYVYERLQLDCFGDDSGLEVEALNQEPGIYSARYSGQGDEANTKLVLEKMEGIGNRKARFKTVISLLVNHEPRGSQGFGYDPIFQPEGYEITLAEMTMGEKNAISHRALAMKALLDWLLL
jgi:XTP/dITP diphosphohydrolase